MPTQSLIWILVVEAVLVVVILAAVLTYVLHGTKDLQARLTMNSRALHRYIKHLLSPEFQAAESERLRETLSLELEEEWQERHAALEAEREVLTAQAQELAERSAALAQERVPVADVESELQAAEAALADDEARQQAFRDELGRLRELVEEQEREIQRLRARINPADLDQTTLQLLDAQQKQRDQQQRMLREMEMCIHVLENELSETRMKLAKAVRRLRNPEA